MDGDITPELLATIELLDQVEALIELSPTEEIEIILQEAWFKITASFPEDFQLATQEDAGAEGLRRYVKIKQFFADPSAHPVSHAELSDYYRSRTEPIDPEDTDFFFLDQ